MKEYNSKHWLSALTLAGLLLATAPAQAQTRTVTLNTGLLNGAGSFSVEYSLANGAAVADGNSSAAISNFSLIGGVLGTVLSPTTGDVTGDLGSTLTLRDDSTASAGFADFAQAFTVNSSSSILSFNLNLSASSVDAGTPDDFYFQIVDPNGVPLATSGPNGIELVNSRYTSTSPVPIGYITQATSNVSADIGFPGIKATVTSAAPVPEASTTISLGLLLTLGLGGLIVSARRKASLPR